MKIDKDTLYITVEPLLRAAGESYTAEIERAAVAEYLGADGYWSITIDQLARLANNDMTALIKNTDNLTITVYEEYLIRGVRKFIGEYIKNICKLIPPKTTAEKAAERACLNMTLMEGLLIFAREYFNLRNFNEAGQITLADLLIARKDAYNKAVYQKKISGIQ